MATARSPLALSGVLVELADQSKRDRRHGSTVVVEALGDDLLSGTVGA